MVVVRITWEDICIALSMVLAHRQKNYKMKTQILKKKKKIIIVTFIIKAKNLDSTVPKGINTAIDTHNGIHKLSSIRFFKNYFEDF